MLCAFPNHFLTCSQSIFPLIPFQCDVGQPTKKKQAQSGHRISAQEQEYKCCHSTALCFLQELTLLDLMLIAKIYLVTEGPSKASLEPTHIVWP